MHLHLPTHSIFNILQNVCSDLLGFHFEDIYKAHFQKKCV